MTTAHTATPPEPQPTFAFVRVPQGQYEEMRRKELAHDDLVKALQDARSHIETYGAAADDVDGTKLTPQAAEAIAAISAALAKAGVPQ